jgi:hypothetical protein
LNKRGEKIRLFLESLSIWKIIVWFLKNITPLSFDSFKIHPPIIFISPPSQKKVNLFLKLIPNNFLNCYLTKSLNLIPFLYYINNLLLLFIKLFNKTHFFLSKFVIVSIGSVSHQVTCSHIIKWTLRTHHSHKFIINKIIFF